MKAGTRITRRYAGILLCGGLFAVVVASAVNTIVDPFRVAGAPWASKKVDPYRDISAKTRTGKAGLIRVRKDWQVGIFGSSRVISSLDPQAAGWGEKRVVNLGMPGGLMYENVAMAEYFIARQPQAELVVLGIDPGDLTDKRDTRPLVDYMASPLNPDGALDRELRYVVGISTFEISLETLMLQVKKTPGEYNDHGFRDRPSHGGGGGAASPGKGQLNFIKNRFVDDARIPEKPGAGTVVNQDKAMKLETLMKHCREEGVRLVMFLHPNHVLLQAKSADLGKEWVPFETDRRELVAMVARVNAYGSGPAVELWDFYSYQAYNRERVRPLEGKDSELLHWRDLEHFTKDVGEGMLSQMMGWPVENPELSAYGEKISTSNVEARIGKLREDYQRYLRDEGAEDVKWKEELVKKGLAK